MTTRTTPLLLAIDGNSLVHRAHHAAVSSGLRGPDGRPTWATNNFLTLLLKVCRKYRPNALIVGFDDHGDALRKQMYPEYKANRSAKEPELYEQLQDIPAMLTQMGVAVVIPPRLEADDVLASAAHQFGAAGWKTMVVTSDRDSFALVSPTTAVLRVMNGGIDNSPLVTVNTLREHADCGVGQYTDYAALRGDASDNLPGAYGIGKVTAAKLLAAFPTVRAAWDAHETDPQSVIAAIGKANATKLVSEQSRTNVERNLTMMAMHTDLALPTAEQATLPLEPSNVLAALAERGLASVRTLALGELSYLFSEEPTSRYAPEPATVPEQPAQPEELAQPMLDLVPVEAGYGDVPPDPQDAGTAPEVHVTRTAPAAPAAAAPAAPVPALTAAGMGPAPTRPTQWALTL